MLNWMQYQYQISCDLKQKFKNNLNLHLLFFEAKAHGQSDWDQDKVDFVVIFF